MSTNTESPLLLRLQQLQNHSKSKKPAFLDSAIESATSTSSYISYINNIPESNILNHVLRTNQSYPPALNDFKENNSFFEQKSTEFGDCNSDLGNTSSNDREQSFENHPAMYQMQDSFNTVHNTSLESDFDKINQYQLPLKFSTNNFCYDYHDLPARDHYNFRNLKPQANQYIPPNHNNSKMYTQMMQNEAFVSNVTINPGMHHAFLWNKNANDFVASDPQQFESSDDNQLFLPPTQPLLLNSDSKLTTVYEGVQTTDSQKETSDSAYNENMDSYFKYIDNQLKPFEVDSITLHSFNNIIHNKESKSKAICSFDLNVFEIPIEVLIKYFNRHSHRLLGIQFILLATIYANEIRPEIAAGLLRLLVRQITHLPLCEEILCNRVSNCKPSQNRLTVYQLALTVWSIAKTSSKYSLNNGENTKNRQTKKYIDDLFTFVANEAINQIEEFQPLSIANIMWAFSKMHIRNDKLFHLLTEHAINQIDSFNAQNIVNVYWSLGTLEIKTTAFTCPVNSSSNYFKLTEVILARLPSFNTQAIANFVWACGKLQWGHHLFASICVEAQNKLKFFKPQEIANFMWAVAKLKLTSLKSVVTFFANHSAANIMRFNLQEVSNIYWCLGTLELGDTNLTPQDLSNVEQGGYEQNCEESIYNCDNIYKRMLKPDARKRNSLNPDDVDLGTNHCNLSLDHPSRLSTNNTATSTNQQLTTSTEILFMQKNSSAASTIETLNNGMSDVSRLVCPTASAESKALLKELLKKVQSFNAQATANVLWTCGRLQWKCAPLCHALEQAIINNINSLRPQNTANCLWALAKLKTTQFKLIHLLVDTACSQLAKFNTQEIANIYWALGTLEITSTALTPMDYSQTTNCSNNNEIIVKDDNFSCIDSLYENKNRNSPKNGQSINAVNQATSTDEFSFVDPLQKKTADTTSCVFGDNSNFQSESSKQNNYYVCRIILDKLQYFKPQEIANFVWACAKLKWKNVLILEKSCLVSLQLRTQFKPQEIGNLLWGLAKLNYRHTKLMVALCNDAASKLNRYIPQNISNIYWALASLDVTSTVLTSDYPKFAKLKHLLTLIKRFNQQEIVNFVWTCYKLNWNHPEVMAVAIEVVFSRLSQFLVIDILNLQQAFRKLGYKDVAKRLVNCDTMCYSEMKETRGF